MLAATSKTSRESRKRKSA